MINNRSQEGAGERIGERAVAMHIADGLQCLTHVPPSPTRSDWSTAGWVPNKRQEMQVSEKLQPGSRMIDHQATGVPKTPNIQV